MSISALSRSQYDSALSVSIGATIPGPVVPNSILLVAVALAAGTSPAVDSLAWAGVPLTKAHRIQADVTPVLVNEWWWVAAPAHGAQSLTGQILGSPRATVEIFYVDYADPVDPFGPIDYAIGSSELASISLSPTHDVGTIVDLFNGRDFPYGIGGSYTPGSGQGFLDLGTVGTAEGFYIVTNKAAANGNSTVSGTIVPPMPWLYSALELRAPGEAGAPPHGESRAMGAYTREEIKGRTGIEVQ